MVKIQTNSQGKVYLTSGGNALLSTARGDAFGGDLYGDVVVDNEFICAPYLCFHNPFITSFSAPNCTRAVLTSPFGGSSVRTLDFSSLISLNASPSFSVAGDDMGLCGWSQVTSVDFSSLSDIGYRSALQYAFAYTPIQDLRFPSLKSTSFGSSSEWWYGNCFDDMLVGVTGCVVHFPSNLQSVIGNWWTVTSGFSGTNTTVLFDLPATE